MTIAFGAAGSAAVGTTSLSCAFPAGITANQMLVAVVANKYPANPPVTPDGWSLLGRQSGGSGSSGADTGQVSVSVFTRVAAGSESGNLAVSLPSANCAVGIVMRYTKDAAKVWVLGNASGQRNTGGSLSWSLSATTDPGVQLGDMLIVASGINSNNFSFASQALTGAGATFTHTERLDGGTANGDQCGALVSQYLVASGRTTALLSEAATATGTNGPDNPAGAAVILRLREILPNRTPLGRLGLGVGF